MQAPGKARKKPATYAGRFAYAAKLRELYAERDARRIELAEELRSATATEISHDAGHMVIEPGRFAGVPAVVEAANRAIDAVDLAHAQKSAKSGSVVQKLVVENELTLESAFLRFALSEEIVAPVSAYLGVVPILGGVDVWCSLPARKTKSSQLWHLDAGDSTQVKVWVHCSDIGAESGPLTALGADASVALAARIGYRFDQGHRVPDEVFANVPQSELIAFEGPVGTVDFVDTSRCFHFGSRVRPQGEPRRVAVFQYVTPYASRFEEEHADGALFAHLCGSDQGEVDRLVLGGT